MPHPSRVTLSSSSSLQGGALCFSRKSPGIPLSEEDLEEEIPGTLPVEEELEKGTFPIGEGGIDEKSWDSRSTERLLVSSEFNQDLMLPIFVFCGNLEEKYIVNFTRFFVVKVSGVYSGDRGV